MARQVEVCARKPNALKGSLVEVIVPDVIKRQVKYIMARTLLTTALAAGLAIPRSAEGPAHLTIDCNENPIIELVPYLEADLADIDAFPLERLQCLLNQPCVSSEDIILLLAQFSPTTIDNPIYPHFTTIGARLRFAEYVLALDRTSENTYIPDLYNCTSFANDTIDRVGPFPKSFIHKPNPGRIMLPMYRLIVTPGFDRVNKKQIKGHAIIAIFLGNTKEDITNRDMWVFYEPQDDSRIQDPMNHLVTAPYMYIDKSDTGPSGLRNVIVGFMRLGNGELVPLTAKQTGIVQKIQIWQVNNGIAGNKMPLLRDLFTPDEPDLSGADPRDIAYVRSVLESSGYFTADEVDEALAEATLPAAYVTYMRALAVRPD